MSIRSDLKILLFKENISLTKIAEELTKATDKKYTMRSLSQKLIRGTLRAEEYTQILDILGYDIKLVKRQ